MALNQRYPHFKHITVTAPRDITSGDPVRVGQIAGVAQTTAAEGEKVTLWLDGSYDLTVAGALTEGQAVYVAANNTLTATVGANFFGVAAAAKGSGTGVAEVAPAGIIIPTPAGSGD